VTTYRTNAGPHDPRERLAELTDAWRRETSNVHVLVELALLEEELRELDGARKHFRALLLLRLDGTSLTQADVFCHLATIELLAGDVPKARAMAERALAADATHARAREILGR